MPNEPHRPEPEHAPSASTRARILALLRRGPASVEELARALRITPSGVRLHLAAMQRDGTVHATATRRGATKPSRMYGLTPEAELRFSRAYVPLLTQTLHVLAERLAPGEFDAFMREVGRGLLAGRPRPHGSVAERAQAASALLTELGGLNDVVDTGAGLRIQAHGCPLAATTARHPEACNALESLLAEFTGLDVAKCCDRADRIRCCFEILPPAAVDARPSPSGTGDDRLIAAKRRPRAV